MFKQQPICTHLPQQETKSSIFFGRRPLPFGGSPLEACSRTSGESNHHRQSVSDTRVPRYQLSHEDTYKKQNHLQNSLLRQPNSVSGKPSQNRLRSKGPPVFFSVRRHLGSRQVVTQCLCQLNELCSILHRLLFGSVKREHGPLRSPDIVHVRWRPHEEKNTKQPKTTKPTPKPNPEKKTSSQWTNQLYANSAAYVLTIKPCMH